MAKPKIGLTTGTVPKWRVGGEHFIPYADSIAQAGGEPVALGYKKRGKLEGCDGILVSGGWDVHPRHYDRRPGDEGFSFDELKAKYKLTWDERRDRYELPLVRKALEMKIPVLGICRGIQLINILLGHKLVPDLPVCVGDTIIHSTGIEGKGAFHEIKIFPSSRIARILPSPRLTVNSYHHQGLRMDDIAPGLKAAALAPDGVVEAVEGTDHPWLVAVQWHPERKEDKEIHEVCKPLFEEFIRQAARCEK